MNVGRNRRKLPWYEYLGVIAAIFVSMQTLTMLDGLGILIAIAAALVGGYAALFLAYELGKQLGRWFPALGSEHVGYFDR